MATTSNPVVVRTGPRRSPQTHERVALALVAVPEDLRRDGEVERHDRFEGEGDDAVHGWILPGRIPTIYDGPATGGLARRARDHARHADRHRCVRRVRRDGRGGALRGAPHGGGASVRRSTWSWSARTAPASSRRRTACGSPSTAGRHGRPTWCSSRAVAGSTAPACAPRSSAAWCRACSSAAHERGAIVGSICTGAMLLAAAGLIEGRRATRITRRSRTCAPRAPRSSTRASSTTATCSPPGGVTSGLDLALHIVEKVAGASMAEQVAREIEYERVPVA